MKKRKINVKQAFVTADGLSNRNVTYYVPEWSEGVPDTYVPEWSEGVPDTERPTITFDKKESKWQLRFTAVNINGYDPMTAEYYFDHITDLLYFLGVPVHIEDKYVNPFRKLK